MSTYRLTDNDRETLERRRRLYESIVSAYEGRGEAWTTDTSGDTLAWVAAGAAVPVVEAIIAPIHARAEEVEAAGTEVARQMVLQVEAHRARAEAARAQVEEATDALIHLTDVAGMRIKAAEKRADDLAAVIERVRALHRPDGGVRGPGAICVACTPDFGTAAEDPAPWPCETAALLPDDTKEANRG